MSKGGGNQQQQHKRRTKSSTTKFTIPTSKVQCQILLNRLTIKFFNCAFYIADKAMYILGPILICLASGIISGLTYVYFYIILPMLCGVNWIYTRSDYDMYWKERGYTVTRPSLNDSDNSEDENISKLTTIFIALSTPIGIFNTFIVTFFLCNILYNYFKCVTTSNSGPNYKVVVRELAQVTNFNYPETNEELIQCKKDQEKKIYERMQRKRNELMAARGTPIRPGEPSKSAAAENKDDESQQQQGSQSSPLMAATTSTSTNKKKEPPKPLPRIHNWQLLSPTEWSYCRYSHQPKPPRSHYDHVTKSLILNMDHYCPWMFNCIGYFNYRYFFNFLWFVVVALFYGAVICYKPFMLLGTKEYRDQVKASGGYTNQLNVYRNGKQLVVKHIQSNSYIPIPTEKTYIALGFMLCLCLALAVMCLGIFHLYLLTSAQSTIEFHGNMSKRKRKGWKNPYSAGSWKKNFELVYGTRYWYLQKNKCSCCTEDENGMSREEDEDDEKYSYRGILGILLAMMPSNREPEFLPLLINGKLVRRKNRNASNVDSKKIDLEMGTVSTNGSTSDQETEDFIMQASKGTNGLVGRSSRSVK